MWWLILTPLTEARTEATRVGVNGFNFRPEEVGVYTFKFWNGKDSSNQNIWIEKTIVVE